MRTPLLVLVVLALAAVSGPHRAGPDPSVTERPPQSTARHASTHHASTHHAEERPAAERSAAGVSRSGVRVDLSRQMR
ncbi:hypothetical protein [Kitasatospora sp. NPDC092286]|uniref:hypothetical protein n=1 Tax=Kitasatospora sp. NPDC092286 TaxID=3364087 RepID=UPI00380376FB